MNKRRVILLGKMQENLNKGLAVIDVDGPEGFGPFANKVLAK